MLCVHWAGWDGLVIFGALGAIAHALRSAGVPKWGLWAGMAVVVQFARKTTSIVPPDQRIAWWPAWGWFAIYVVSQVALTAATRRAAQHRKTV